ncbi:PREDICTED: protein FAM173A [Colobus angolensis palliatus]|uniref:protein FAM173A n=1 Tax=Colobus angolensis palliatus TaxID=336983 RepID=UPI0005F4000A|nr:PREDICTED: protein FAM173A [Colobus angolensis palliatus]
MGVLAPGRSLIPGSRFPTGSLGSSRPARAPVCFWGQDRPSSKACFPSFHAKDAQPRFPGPLAPSTGRRQRSAERTNGADPRRGARLPLRVSRSGRGRGELRPTSSGSGPERPVDSRRLPVQVPYVGASARQVEHVLSLLRGRPGKTVDLGSGDGRIVLAAHRCGLRPAVGYELNPWLVALARLHAWRAGCAGSVCYRRKDLWKVSLRDCRNVSVFLAPSVLPLLEDKLRAELPAGARVVSGRFPLPTWQPVAVAGEGLDRVWAYDVPGGG